MIPLRKYTLILASSLVLGAGYHPLQAQGIEQMLQEIEVEDLLSQVKQQGFIKNYMSNLFQNFKSGEPLIIQGGVGVNSRSYRAFGLQNNRQNPFAGTINANVNISVYNKLNIPISALISNQSTQFRYPTWGLIRELIDEKINEASYRLVRFGTSPSYKWIRLHGGHRTMTFSDFTLSGLNFLGGGVELTPGRLRLSAMSGRLAKAQPFNISIGTPNFYSYHRTGHAIKVGYAFKSNDEEDNTSDDFIDLILFNGKDDPNSVEFPSDSLNVIFPQENQVLAIHLRRTVYEKVKMELEVASSAFTPDVQEGSIPGSPFPHSGLFNNRQSTQYRSAIKGKIDFQGDGFILGLGYKRVEPEFKSFGAFYFDTDSEEITAGTSFGLFKNKVLINAVGGIEQRNVLNTSSTTDSRFIYATDLTFSDNAFNLGITYSNNTSRVVYVPSNEPDSLIALIVTQDAGFNSGYTILDRGENQHALNLIANFQQVSDEFDGSMLSEHTKMFVSSLIYSLTLSNGAWNITPRLSYNQNELKGNKSDRYSIGCAIRKSFLSNNLATTLDFKYFTVDQKEFGNTNTLYTRLGATLNLKKSQSISLHLSWLQNRKKGSGGDKDFSEMVISLGYAYAFNTSPFKNKEQRTKK